MGEMMDYLAKVIQRKPVIRFLMAFGQEGGCNLGTSGLDRHAIIHLEKAGLIQWWHYKPYRPLSGREYIMVSRGDYGTAFAEILRAALRNKNAATIMGLGDGRGSVAFDRDWTERRHDIQTAALTALAEFRNQRPDPPQEERG
jgi:hypothetical protein